ncbi:MAG: adenine phosphoribosyltransferase [Candidatus Micrarchaeia archaeon]
MQPNELEARLKSKIRSIPDFPKKGIILRDITPVFQDYELFNACIDAFAERFRSADYVAGIEAKGFILGAALARKLDIGFVPVYKKNDIPVEKISKQYELEYGTDVLEVFTESVEKSSRIVIVDELIATGGTAHAAAELLEKLGGHVVGAAFVIELEALHGRDKLTGIEVFSLVRY